MIPVGRVCAAAAGLQREQGVGRETTCALECALLQLRSGMRWYREERHREDAPAPFEQPVLVALGSPVPPRPILSSTCLPSSLPPSHQLPPLLHGSPFCLISSSPSPPPPPFQSAVETELLAPSCPFLCLHSSPLHTLPTLSSPPQPPLPPPTLTPSGVLSRPIQFMQGKVTVRPVVVSHTSTCSRYQLGLSPAPTATQYKGSSESAFGLAVVDRIGPPATLLPLFCASPPHMGMHVCSLRWKRREGAG